MFARSGDDAFRVDQANGAFADEALSVDGGSGNDTLDGGDGIETFRGGSGNDAVDGNRGDNTGILGSGNDIFRWDPGDGSDVVEGRSGADTLDFNGAGANENMSLSREDGRSVFLRDVANIRMGMDDDVRPDDGARRKRARHGRRCLLRSSHGCDVRDGAPCPPPGTLPGAGTVSRRRGLTGSSPTPGSRPAISSSTSAPAPVR